MSYIYKVLCHKSKRSAVKCPLHLRAISMRSNVTMCVESHVRKVRRHMSVMSHARLYIHDHMLMANAHEILCMDVL